MVGEDNDFVVIGAGLMRTGTTSLQIALQRLLGGKCYHMNVVFRNPRQAEFWKKATTKTPSDNEWRSFLVNYKSGVDFPPCAFYKDLMEVYPNAKVILSVRDPEHWHKSLISTIAPAIDTFKSFPTNVILRLSGHSRVVECIDALFTKVFGHDYNLRDKDLMIAAYHRHVSEVKRFVPPQRLLIFKAKDGWEPLCHFLGVSVPNEPFPHANHTDEFVGKTSKLQLFSNVALLTVLLASSGLCYWIMNNSTFPTILSRNNL